AQHLVLGRVACGQLLRGRGDRLLDRRASGKEPRTVHHQKADQLAARIDHGEADLAADLLRLGDAGSEHLETRLMRDAVGCHEIGPRSFPLWINAKNEVTSCSPRKTLVILFQSLGEMLGGRPPQRRPPMWAAVASGRAFLAPLSGLAAALAVIVLAAGPVR